MRKDTRWFEVHTSTNSTISGRNYNNVANFFGAFVGSFPQAPVTGIVEFARPFNACTPLTNNMTGKWCVVLRTLSGCGYGPKIQYCQEAGAIGVIVQNYVIGIGGVGTGNNTGLNIPVLLIELSILNSWSSYKTSYPTDNITLTVHYGNCLGSYNLTNTYGRFRNAEGSQVYGLDLLCDWNIQNPIVHSTTTTSVGFYLSEYLDSQVGTVTKVYQTSPGHADTLIQQVRGAAATTFQQAQDPQKLFTACAPNSFRVEFNATNTTNRLCSTIYPYSNCDAGFTGNYYTCPGPSRLNSQTGVFSPGCSAVTNCSWYIDYVISPLDIQRDLGLALYFNDLNLAEGAEIRIYDQYKNGTMDISNLVSTITSKTTVVPFIVATSTYSLFVEYTTSSASVAAASSFTGIFHNGGCSRIPVKIELMKGKFTLAGGSSRYAPNSICRWTLKAVGSNPLIPITFDLRTTMLEPNFDRIIIYDGAVEGGKILYNTDTSVLVGSYTTTSSEVLIAFNSNTQNELQNQEIIYEYAYCGIEVEITAGAGPLSQGNWFALGLEYDNMSMTPDQRHVVNAVDGCSWIIKALPSANYIEIFFQSMFFEHPDESLVILDSNNEVVAEYTEFSGIPPPLLVRSPTVLVSYFTPYGETSNSTFTSVYNAGKCFGIVPVEITASNSTINDGSFDGFVAPGQLCNWIIRPDISSTSIYQTRVIRITFTSVGLTGLDVVRVYQAEKLIATINGNNIPPTIEAFSTYVKIEFSSDTSSANRIGWEFKYTTDDGCPPGYIINGTDVTCTKCPNGYDSAGGQASVCTLCAPGYYSTLTTGGVCRECPLGTYQPDSGKTSCIACPRGYFTNNTASSKCNACTTGYFNIDEGSSTCNACPLGQFQDREGQSKCFTCDKQYYAPMNGTTTCTSCPNNTISSFLGAYDVKQCLCKPEYYGKSGEVCTGCPKGATCAGNETVPVPQPGYWQSDVNSLVMVKCYPSDACRGGIENLCNDGYEGLRCGACAEKPNRYYRLNDKCTICPSTPAWWMVLTVVIPIVFCFWLLQSVSRNFKSGSIAIGFDFMQVLALTSSFRLEWPSSIKDVYSALSFLNFNIELIAPECTMHADYWSKWWLILALPMVMLGVFLILFGILKGVVLLFPKISKRHVQFLFNKDYFINGYVMFLSLIHPLLLSKSLEVFDCIEDGAGGSYMMEHQIQNCHVPSWNSKQPIAIIGIILYGVGIPILFFVILLFYRKRLHEPSVIAKFGSIYFCYSNERFFWEVIVKLKKFSLVIVRFIFSNGDSGDGTLWTAAIGAVILAIYFLLAVYFKPFSFKRNNGLQIGVSIINLGAVFAGILFFSQKFTDESASILRTILFVIFFITILCIGLHVIREFFFGFRTSRRMKEMIPNFLFKYNIFSISETEIADISDGFSAKPLYQNMDDWLHLHTRKEREELLETLEPLGISNVRTRPTFWQVIGRIGNDILRRPDRSTKIHNVASSVREVEMKSTKKKGYGNNLSLEVVSNDI